MEIPTGERVEQEEDGKSKDGVTGNVLAMNTQLMLMSALIKTAVHLKSADSADSLQTLLCGLHDTVEMIKMNLASEGAIPPDSISLSFQGQA